MTQPVLLLLLVLLFIVPASSLRADSLTQGPPVPPIPFPEFLGGLDELPPIVDLPVKEGGSWVYTWRDGKWSVRWVRDGSVIGVGQGRSEAPADSEYQGGGQRDSLALTANPEPSTWMLLAAGLGGIAVWRRKRGVLP